jgi:hypothetical protein
MCFNFFAKLNLARANKLITPEQFNTYKFFCDNSYISQTAPKDLKILDFGSSIFFTSNSSYKKLKEFFDTETGSNYDETVKVLSDIFEIDKDDDTVLSISNKKFGEELISLVKYFNNQKYLNESKDYSKLTDEELSKEFDNFQDLISYNTAFTFKTLDRLLFYKELPKAYDVFVNIQKEQARRGLKTIPNKKIETHELDL